MRAARTSSWRWSSPTIFGGEVDFQSELQPGDSFRVLFEKTSHDGEFSGYGAILGASIEVDGTPTQAFRWQDPRRRARRRSTTRTAAR